MPMPLFLALVIECGPQEFDSVHEINVRVTHTGAAVELGRVTAGFQHRQVSELNPGEPIIMPVSISLFPVPVSELGGHDVHVSVDGGEPKILTAYAIPVPS